MNPSDLELSHAIELLQNNRPREALERLRSGQSEFPHDFRFPMLLGDLLMQSGHPVEALGALDIAVKLDPSQPGPHGQRALVLRDLGRLPEAVAAAERALSLAPSDPAVLWASACVFYAARNYVDAAAGALKVSQLHPELTEAAELASLTLFELGEVDQACDVLARHCAAHPDDQEAALRLGRRMAYAPSRTPAQRTAHAIELGRRMAARVLSTAAPPLTDPNPDRPLRIGYIAQDISERSAIAFFIEEVFAHHDRARYPITCYLTQASRGRMTNRMLGHLTAWVDASPLDDAALAARIRADKIDILVDLAGRTVGNRLGAILRNPAPIVINAIGDPQTSGLAAVHYRIADAVTDPPGAESLWIEKLIRLPGCFLCYRPPDDAPPTRVPRPADSRSPIVFGCLNILAKIGPQVVELWSRILHSAEGSKLLLKSDYLANPAIRRAVESKFSRHGIAPDRLLLLERSPALPDHLRTYEKIDIALDPFPYNGTTTSCEALWMGVPLIALAGDSHASRVGASLLTAAGLPELVAQDADSYVRIAHQLAADPARLNALHASLRKRLAGSILCNGPAHARALESEFRRVWKERCRPTGPPV